MEDIYQWALQVLFFEDKQDKKKLLLNKEGYCLCQSMSDMVMFWFRD